MAIKLKNLKERLQRIETANKMMFYIALVSFIITLLAKLSGVSILPGAPILMDGAFIFTIACFYVTIFSITFGYQVTQTYLRIRNKLFYS